MDNAVARLVSNAEKLQASGETMGDPFEISRIRREDFSFHEGRTEGDDILNSGKDSSGVTNRGHQGPSAFLIMASGLDKVRWQGFKMCYVDDLSRFCSMKKLVVNFSTALDRGHL